MKKLRLFRLKNVLSREQLRTIYGKKDASNHLNTCKSHSDCNEPPFYCCTKPSETNGRCLSIGETCT